ncbi:MAG TPA: polymer-forming cytoskeletal protein [Polyangiaceae bacterium]|nr:polymer-forming cytoskeletal protein [Polyangiaceae bacterium]
MDVSVPVTEITALLGRGTHFEGKLHFEGRLRIDGSFRGEIRGNDVLVLGDGADVEAEIDVAVLIVKGGSLRGNVRASQAIELHIPSRVSGSLHAPEIFMDKGVQFSGACTIAPLDSKADQSP